MHVLCRKGTDRAKHDACGMHTMRTHIDIVSLVLLLVNDLVNLYRFLRGNTGKITTSNVLTFALQYENR